MSFRPIEPVDIRGLTIHAVAGALPAFRFVDPANLLVEEAYQRPLLKRGVALIRRIVERFSWSRFRPPVVAETPAGLVILDGQHTATAALSRGLRSIPVQVTDAPELVERAAAFVALNRDRLAMTPAQVHFGALAAGDEDALTMAQVCERAGVRILRVPPSGAYAPGDTLAVTTIARLVDRRGAMAARKVLDVLVDAGLAPVTADAVKAVDALLNEPEFKGEVDAAAVAKALRERPAGIELRAAEFAAAHKVRRWRGLACVLFREAAR